MPSRFAPQSFKDDFYKKFQDPKNYKTLIIKVNITTKDLKNIFDNNVWNLKDKASKFQQVTKTENNEYYNSWLNEVYLLDYIEVPKMKDISKDDFLKSKYKTEGNTDRTELIIYHILRHGLIIYSPNKNKIKNKFVL